MKLASRLSAVKPSATLALNAKAKTLASKGIEVASFAAGEPDFDTPAAVKEAAIEALRAGFTKYTPSAGIPELRAAICEKLDRENGIRYVPEQVIVSSGAKHSLFNLFQALLSEGDEVVIFAPYWVSYPDMVKLAGGTPVIVHTTEQNGFAPEPAALAKAITPRTRAVILNSPSNPTGAVLDRKALEQIANVVRPHPNVLVVTDDIYEKLLYTDAPFVTFLNVAPDLYDRTAVVNGFSKAFSMTGWRLGYTAGPRELIAGMQIIQDQSTSGATSFAQKGAVAALKGPKDEVDKMVAEFKARRDLIVRGLNAIPGIRCPTPHGAFYAFPNIEGWFGKSYQGQTITGSLQVSTILIDDFRVAAVPGEPFGAEGFLRLSFATSRPIIEKGLAWIGELAKSLR